MLITVMAVTDPVLKEFRAALGAMYGERIERVVLFGSRAPMRCPKVTMTLPYS